MLLRDTRSMALRQLPRSRSWWPSTSPRCLRHPSTAAAMLSCGARLSSELPACAACGIGHKPVHAFCPVLQLCDGLADV